MSSNTNTLFWVITGAVVVLGIFLLTNNSGTESVNTIANKFDGIYNEQVSKLDNSKNDTNEDNIDEEVPSTEEEVISPAPLISDMNKLEEFMKVSDKPYCKDHQVLDDRISVEFHSYIDGVLKYTVTNISGQSLPSFRIYTDIYDCETDEKILGCFAAESPFAIGDYTTRYCIPGTGHEFNGDTWYSVTTAEIWSPK